MAEETTVPLSVKIPPSVKERLETDAGKNFRSTTSHLLYILDLYFSELDTKEKSPKQSKRLTVAA